MYIYVKKAYKFRRKTQIYPRYGRPSQNIIVSATSDPRLSILFYLLSHFANASIIFAFMVMVISAAFLATTLSGSCNSYNPLPFIPRKLPAPIHPLTANMTSFQLPSSCWTSLGNSFNSPRCCSVSPRSDAVILLKFQT